MEPPDHIHETVYRTDFLREWKRITDQLREWGTLSQQLRAAAEQVAAYRDRILPKADRALRLVQTGFEVLTLSAGAPPLAPPDC